MPFKIAGDTSGNVAEVDAHGNQLVNLPTDPQAAGYVRLLDSDGNPLDTTENGFLRVSSEALVFYDQVDGAALNTNLWTYSVGTMTVVQANGFIGLNAGASVAAGAYAILQSIKSIPLYGTLPLIVEMNAKALNAPAANATIELGIGSSTTTAAPADGAFFRWTPAGQFYAITNNAGVESSSAQITGPYSDTTGAMITMPPSGTVIHLYAIEIVEDHCRFYVDDTLVADIQTPAGQAFPFNAGRQTVYARVFNGGTSPSLAPQLFIGQVIANQEDLNQSKPWGDLLCSLGRGFHQSPTTPFSQTANHANSTSPASATLSNTVAGYATLGGRFQFAAPAGAVTDYALFAYQIPTGYQFVCKGVSISSVSVGAAGSLTVPTVLDWSLGVNANAVSLATAESPPSTISPRRVPVGMQSFPTTTLLGGQAADIDRRFDAPLVVDGGRYLHVIVQMPYGAATASQIIRGDVMIDGYFE